MRNLNGKGCMSRQVKSSKYVENFVQFDYSKDQDIVNFLNNIEDKDSYIRELIHADMQHKFQERLFELLKLYDSSSIPMVDKLITGYFELDDEAREELKELIQIKLKRHTDPERSEALERMKNEQKQRQTKTESEN